jgi:hypothetical protein
VLMEMYCYCYYYYYFPCFLNYELCGLSKRRGAIKTNVLKRERIVEPQGKSGLSTAVTKMQLDLRVQRKHLYLQEKCYVTHCYI